MQKSEAARQFSRPSRKIVSQPTKKERVKHLWHWSRWDHDHDKVKTHEFREWGKKKRQTSRDEEMSRSDAGESSSREEHLNSHHLNSSTAREAENHKAKPEQIRDLARETRFVLALYKCSSALCTPRCCLVLTCYRKNSRQKAFPRRTLKSPDRLLTYSRHALLIRFPKVPRTGQTANIWNIHTVKHACEICQQQLNTTSVLLTF